MGYTDSWADHRLTCMHGIREGLDSHECPDCYVLAREMGMDLSNGKTYLYRNDPRPSAKETNNVS